MGLALHWLNCWRDFVGNCIAAKIFGSGFNLVNGIYILVVYQVYCIAIKHKPEF
jgi:hypothetical protein